MLGDFRRDLLRLALVLGAALLVAFAPIALGFGTLTLSSRAMPSVYPTGASALHQAYFPNVLDMVGAWLTEPWLATEHRFLASLQSPLWNPYDGYGAPFAPTMQPESYSPFALVFGVAPPSPWLFGVFCLARLFVAGLGAALFVRLFAGFWPALVAGLAAEFGGYGMGFLTQPDVSVAVVFPAVLFATELAVRRPGPKTIAGLALAMGAMDFGGMPESALLLGATCIAYGVVRAVTEPRRGVLARVGAIACAHVLAACAAAIIIVPFAQILGVSSDVHQTTVDNVRRVGLIHDTDVWHAFATELAPFAFGRPWNDIADSAFGGFPALRGYVGAVAAFFALLAIVPSARRLPRRGRRDVAVAFFALTIVVCLLKRFGVPPVQALGNLPVLQWVIFQKYLEPIVDPSVAILAGFGFAAVLRRRVGALQTLAAFAVVLYALWRGYIEGVHVEQHVVADLVAALGLAIVALAVAALATFAATQSPAFRARRFRRVAVGAMFVELALCYPVPNFLFLNGLQPASLDAYAGGPYVAYLQRQTASDATRVFGTGGVLHPNWAGAFGLYDPAVHNAIYLRRFSRFMDAFGASDLPERQYDADRYTGLRAESLGTALRRRWLTLSSIRFVATPIGRRDIVGDNELLARLWDQNFAHVHGDWNRIVRPQSVRIGGRDLDALVEQPPRGDLLLETHVATRARALDVGMLVPDSLAYGADTVTSCSAPVRFGVHVEDGTGRVLGRLDRVVDPKRARYVRARVTLAPAADATTRVTFTTATTWARSLCRPLAAWVDAELAGTPRAHPLREVFRDAGAVVYRYDDPLPRASVFHDVRTFADAGDALAALASDDFDPRRTAIAVAPHAIAAVPARAPDDVRLVDERNTVVRIDATLGSAGLVMLNDTFAPGWRAVVDGRERPIVQTDYLFRGVLVDAGRHDVRFVYRSPILTAGVDLTLASLAACVALLFVPLHRMRPAPARRAVTREAITG